ncbi:MAG: PfkB family carbohydrate kinase [Victivallales bacterium]|nr:PfkB family carbohydrate kinase [Victivallales bacterium]
MKKKEMNAKKILALGPNPAWQKTLFFKEMNPGKVNRAHAMQSFASGKGINFCRAARCWGNREVELLQFAGGRTGEDLCAYLKAEGIPSLTVKIAAATRICCTCLPSGQPMTELIEPSPRIRPEEIRQYHALLRDNLSRFAGVAFCGTLPAGCPIEIYRHAAEIINAAGLPLLVDSWQDITPVLETGNNIIFKVNTEEIKLVAAETDIVRAINKVLTEYSLTAVAVTDGPGKAYLAYDHKLFTYELPVLDKIVSSLGCGDTNAAVFLSEYLAGTEPEAAFARGLAAASANCLSATCGNFDTNAAAELYAKIKINADILK